MEVRTLKENEDGSLDVVFDMSDEEKEMLLNLAIITAIENGIKEGRKYATNLQDSASTRCSVVQDTGTSTQAQS
jgi:hypothetical protein